MYKKKIPNVHYLQLHTGRRQAIPSTSLLLPIDTGTKQHGNVIAITHGLTTDLLARTGVFVIYKKLPTRDNTNVRRDS